MMMPRECRQSQGKPQHTAGCPMGVGRVLHTDKQCTKSATPAQESHLCAAVCCAFLILPLLGQ